MKSLSLSLFALFFFSQILTAQNTVSGTITDTANKGVYFATVAIFQQSDSSIVRGAVSDEQGDFSLGKIKDGIYYLKVSMLGYATDYQVISFPTDHQKSLQITLGEDSGMLAEATIEARKPLLIQKADRLVVNVADNLTSMNNNLLDVMKNVPGVIVTGQKLSMAGQQNVTILINGKTTRYMDVNTVLQDMPGDNVERVEVIHQPGSEFDAEGTGPIINIILKKNSLHGTNGNVRLGIGKGYLWKQKASVNLSHQENGLNVAGGVGWRNNPYYDEMLITRRIGDDVYNQRNVDPNLGSSYRANLNTDWDMTDRHRIGFATRYIDWGTDYSSENRTNIDFANPNEADLRLVTMNDQNQTWKMFTFNPYYQFEIDTNGQKLELDFNYVNINSTSLNTLINEEQNFGVDFGRQQYRQPGFTKIYTTQLDYTYPISSTVDFMAGAKYSFADLDNDLGSFELASDGEWTENLNQSNHFLFTERIAATYGKLNFTKGKWSGTAGLRYEHSDSEGYSITLDSTTTRLISKLFPSASLSRSITGELGATLAYSYRIDRPRYSNLNPFVFYLDPFTFEEGNPLLRPALTNSYKFNLTYEQQPFFNIEYKNTNNVMVEMTRQNDETGETSLTTVNLDKFEVMTGSLFFPLDFIPGITGYGGYIASNLFYDSPYLDAQFERSLWTHTAFLQTNFTLPGKIQSEITGWYVSGALEGIVEANWMYGVDVGFSRDFLNDKLKVSFGVDGLLQRFMTGQIRYENMDLDITSRWDAPVANLQVTYKFGNQYIKSSKTRNSSARDEMNRASKE